LNNRRVIEIEEDDEARLRRSLVICYREEVAP
jgi:hypothetical protein